MISKNTAIFLASVVGSFLFWLSINASVSGLTNFFVLLQVKNNPQLFSAQALQTPLYKIIKEKPIRKPNAADFQSSALSALSVFVGENGKAEILFEKNADQSLPIASITKLMSAIIAIEQYQPKQLIAISEEAANKEEPIGNFKAGEIVSANNLLNSMLIESSNKAAEAFSSALGDAQFLNLMNQQAQTLGLQKTFFADAAGVDPNNPTDPTNVSSAHDLFILAKHIKTQYPKIFDVLSLPQYAIYAQDKTTDKEILHHIAKSTNEFLAGSTLPVAVIAGKTGWTPEAKGCLLLLVESPSHTGYIINVILGSDDRFKDMAQLVAWATASYEF